MMAGPSQVKYDPRQFIERVMGLEYITNNVFQSPDVELALAEYVRLEFVRDPGKCKYCDGVKSNCTDPTTCTNLRFSTECNDDCHETCGNKRLMETTRFPKTYVAEVRPREYAVFAGEDIPRGAFIIQFVGEVIHGEPESDLVVDIDSSGFFIDQGRKCNESSLIRSSCQPNAVASSWGFTDMSVRVLLRASIDIPKGTEINYLTTLDVTLDGAKCNCGATNCISTLKPIKVVVPIEEKGQDSNCSLPDPGVNSNVSERFSDTETISTPSPNIAIAPVSSTAPAEVAAAVEPVRKKPKTSSDGLRCPDCNVKVKAQKNLNRHMRYSCPNRKNKIIFACPNRPCEKTSEREDNILRHSLTSCEHRPAIYKIKRECPDCKIKVSDNASLKRHQAFHCSKGKRLAFSCPYKSKGCKLTFSQDGLLLKHVKKCSKKDD